MFLPFFIFLLLHSHVFAVDNYRARVNLAGHGTAECDVEIPVSGRVGVKPPHRTNYIRLSESESEIVRAVMKADSGIYYRVQRDNGGYSGALLAPPSLRLRIDLYNVGEPNQVAKIRAGYLLGVSQATKTRYMTVRRAEEVKPFDLNELTTKKTIVHLGRAGVVAAAIQEVNPATGTVTFIPAYFLDHPPGTETTTRPERADVVIRSYKGVPISALEVDVPKTVYEEARSINPALIADPDDGEFPTFGYQDPYSKGHPRAEMKNSKIEVRGNLMDAQVRARYQALCKKAYGVIGKTNSPGGP